MPKLKIQDLHSFIRDIFMALGAPRASAECVTEILLRAQISGHPSHGVLRVAQYSQEIRSGKLDPIADPEVVRETSVTALIDGKCGFGQVIASRALQVAMEKVREHGLAAVGTTRSYHIGRLGDYAEQSARKGFIALLWANGMVPPGRVTPYGGKKGVLGTNPMAAGIPADETGAQIVVDFATAAIAEGKIRVARAKGEPIPAGMAIDSEGNECTDPEQFYQGGAILPFGGHKGYGLSVLCDVLAGLVTGSATPCMQDYEPSNSLFMILLDPQCFCPLPEFRRDVLSFANKVKSIPPAEGHEEVLLPGEPEYRAARANRDMVDVVDSTWTSLCEIGQSTGVEPPAESDDRPL